MNILYLVFNIVGKGTYWRAYNFGKVLAKHGHKVHLIATSQDQKWRIISRKEGNLTIVETPDLLSGMLRSGWDIWNTLNRIFWLRGKSYDIIHAFECRPVVIYPALFARRTSKKLVIDWADWFGAGGSVEVRPNPIVRTIVRPLDTFFETYYRRYADAHTVINKVLLNKLKSTCPDVPTLLIRNGATRAKLTEDKIYLRKKLGLPLNANIIGFVGGIYEQDAILMAKSMDAVVNLNENTYLLLIGYFNRPIEKWMQNPGRVIRTGTLDNHNLVYEYLTATDICWLPLTDCGANTGRWPYKLTDYMTSGRPVVATAIGDMVEFIAHYQIGITTDVNPAAIANATIKLFEDRQKQIAYGRNAYHVAQNDLSWETLTKQLMQFYEKVLNG